MPAALAGARAAAGNSTHSHLGNLTTEGMKQVGLSEITSAPWTGVKFRLVEFLRRRGDSGRPRASQSWLRRRRCRRLRLHVLLETLRVTAMSPLQQILEMQLLLFRMFRRTVLLQTRRMQLVVRTATTAPRTVLGSLLVLTLWNRFFHPFPEAFSHGTRKVVGSEMFGVVWCLCIQQSRLKIGRVSAGPRGAQRRSFEGCAGSRGSEA